MNWKKGDEYPEDWPQWLKDADIEWCDVEIKDDRVIWNNGTWNGGIWHRGTWNNGIWHGGSWYRGIWNNGIWYRGVWSDGTWNNGSWKDGTWYYGTWVKGAWSGGSWHGGSWYDSTERPSNTETSTPEPKSKPSFGGYVTLPDGSDGEPHSNIESVRTDPSGALYIHYNNTPLPFVYAPGTWSTFVPDENPK